MNAQNDEILETNPIITDSRGKFSNNSADSFANNGRGKLTETQLTERALLHAKNQMFGSPSIPEITKHWLKAYKVTMSVQSEYEWIKNNQERVNSSISEMEEQGDLPVLATPNTVISTMLGNAGRNLLETIKINKKHQVALATSMNAISDPYAEVGAENRKNYLEMEVEDRKKYDERLQALFKVNKVQASNYKIFSENVTKQSASLVELMKVITDLNKSGQSIDAMLAKKVRDELKDMGLQLQDKRSKANTSPMEPIEESDRIN